jgi:4-amino-4-deoxy-L-arabinose transferase-like glycosyltransferase
LIRGRKATYNLLMSTGTTTTIEAAADSLPDTREPTLARKAPALDVAAVIVACVVFSALCLYQLDLPGLYPDEAFDVVPSMQIVLGHPVDVQRGASLHLFGTDLPLMSSSDYQGPTSTYLAIPFFAVGGVSVFSLRTMTVIIGLLGVLLTFFLARAWFGSATARLAVVMMAVSPAWVFWSRVGVYVVSEVVPITAGALLALTAWVRRRPFGERNAPLYVAAFLLGLGLATKLLFVWVLVALAACAFLLYAPLLWETKRAWLRNWLCWLRVALLASLASSVGALPFLLYNVLTRGTYHLLVAGLTSPTTTHGVNNSAYLQNLWIEADAFKVLLDGGYFWFQGVAGRVYNNPITPGLFSLAAIGLLALVIEAHRTGASDSQGIESHAVDLRRVAVHPLFVPAVLLSGAIAVVLVALFLAPSGTAMLTITLLAVGILALIWITWRGLRSAALTGWAARLLLGAGVVTGTAWWFGGAVRPSATAPGILPVDAAGVIFWASGAALMLLLGFDRRPAPRQRTIVFILAFTGLVVAQSAVTVSGLWSTHILLILPLPQIAIAAFGVTLGARFSERRLNRIQKAVMARLVPAVVALLVAIPVILLDLWVDYSYHRDLTLTGGATTFSDSIYGLAGYLDARKPRPNVVAMDWGFKRPIQLLTQDRVNPIEAFGYSPDATPEFRRGLRELLSEPNTLYLFHPPESTAYHRFDAFEEEARFAGKTVSLVETFYVRDGKPNYLVYSAR